MIETQSHDDGRFIITLNRPKRRNALDNVAMAELRDTFVTAAANPNNRCLVLKGAGGGFSAGRDLKQAADLDQDAALAQHADNVTFR